MLIISYSKPYNCVQIICIKYEYLEPCNCGQKTLKLLYKILITMNVIP